MWNLSTYMQTFLQWKKASIGHPARSTWVATEHPECGCLIVRQFQSMCLARPGCPGCPGCEKKKARFHQHFVREIKGYVEELKQTQPGLVGLQCFAELPVVQYKQHPGDYQFSRVPVADMVFTHVKAMHAGQVLVVELDSHLHGDRPFQGRHKSRQEALQAVRKRDQAKDSLYKGLEWHSLRLTTSDVEDGIIEDRWFQSLRKLLLKHCSVYVS